MEIPLTLRKRKDGAIVYAIPLWYRLVTGAMLAVVAGSILESGEAPSLIAWIVLLLLALGILYEERWTANPEVGELRHCAGILPFTTKVSIPFGQIASFRLSAFAKGTIPGTEDEHQEKERAFALLNASISSSRGLGTERPNFLRPKRKSYLNLILATKDDQVYLVDSLPAAKAARFVKTGRALAEACGAEFTESEKD